MKCKFCGIEYNEESVTSEPPNICLECDDIRNQFAATALTGIIPGLAIHLVNGAEPTFDATTEAQEISKRAFEVADAMMKARRGEG